MNGAIGFIPTTEQIAKDLISKGILLFEKQNRNKPKTFLDLGSAIGNVLYIAQVYGLIPYGVELNDACIEISKKLLPNVEIEKANLLNWKPNRNFDLVYFYKPFEDIDLYKRFLRHLETIFPDGQIIISANWEHELNAEFFAGVGLENLLPNDVKYKFCFWKTNKKI